MECKGGDGDPDDGARSRWVLRGPWFPSPHFSTAPDPGLGESWR